MSIKKVARMIAALACLFAVAAPATVAQANVGGQPPPAGK
jgi:hypothetical protein